MILSISASTFLKDIDLVVAAAGKVVYYLGGHNVTESERSRLINRLADLIEMDAQELAELELLDT